MRRLQILSKMSGRLKSGIKESFLLQVPVFGILLVFLFVLDSCSVSKANYLEKEDEVINLADPSIFLHENTYYLYGTGAKNGFKVYTSKDLKTWKIPENGRNGFALHKNDVFGDRNFWAPQVFKFSNKFYMAYTANERIALAVSDDPAGPFKQVNKEPISSQERMIDPFIYIDEKGIKYLYHVRVANGGNRIFVGELKDDFSGIRKGTLRECIRVTEDWEDVKEDQYDDWPVTEGPTVLKYNDLYYLLYSANHYRSPYYAVGYAISESPLGPWVKAESNPVLSRKLIQKYGTGHGDFFQGKDGKYYYVFHTHQSEDKVGPRKTAIINLDLGDNQDIEIKENTFSYLKGE